MTASFTREEAIGLIGTGRMGGPIGQRLVAAGRSVFVHSRSASERKDLVQAGATERSSPAEVVRAARTVLLALPNTAVVQDVMSGADGILSAGLPAIVVDLGTTDVLATRTLARVAEASDVVFVDAPLSGGAKGAADGTLSVMVGADPKHFAEVERLLEPIAALVTHCGPTGSGQVAKACNQILVVSAIQATAEVLVLAASAGVDPSVVRRALLGGYAASRVLDVHGARMLERSFKPGAPATEHLKDAQIATRLASNVGAPLTVLESAMSGLERLIARGDDGADAAALITIAEEQARAIRDAGKRAESEAAR